MDCNKVWWNGWHQGNIKQLSSLVSILQQLHHSLYPFFTLWIHINQWLYWALTNLWPRLTCLFWSNGSQLFNFKCGEVFNSFKFFLSIWNQSLILQFLKVEKHCEKNNQNQWIKLNYHLYILSAYQTSSQNCSCFSQNFSFLLIVFLFLPNLQFKECCAKL